MFCKKQQMYQGTKSQLLKIFNATPYLISTIKKDALTLDFSEIVNSQPGVTTAKTFNKFVNGIIKLLHNPSSGCSCIYIVSDSYFDNSLKSHTLEAGGCGQFFPITEVTSMPKDFQDNFLRHKRNKVGLKSFLDT